MQENSSSMKSLVAYEKIRDLILTGEKLPGTRLVLAELETELGIGRGPIREALMRLDRSGLVRNVPYKGAIVAAPPKPREIAMIFGIRIDLEVKLGLEAIDRITELGISRMRELHLGMKAGEDNFYALDREFHNTLYEASELPYLCLTVHKLIESVESYLSVLKRDEEDTRAVMADHEKILEAVVMKDRELMREVLARNIEAGRRVVEKTFSRFKGF